MLWSNSKNEVWIWADWLPIRLFAPNDDLDVAAVWQRERADGWHLDMERAVEAGGLRSPPTGGAQRSEARGRRRGEDPQVCDRIMKSRVVKQFALYRNDFSNAFGVDCQRL